MNHKTFDLIFIKALKLKALFLNSLFTKKTFIYAIFLLGWNSIIIALTPQELDDLIDKTDKSYEKFDYTTLMENAVSVVNQAKETTNILEGIENESCNRIIKKKLQVVLKDENNWKYLMNKFVNVHPAFLDSLKHKFPNLTKNDLDFCALI